MRRPPRIHVPRWLRWVIAVPAVLGPVAILAFIGRAEWAHDERRCPFELVEQRVLAPGVVALEERRSCLPNLEERRYRVERPDRERVLGRHRFEPADFGEGYGWQAELGKDDQVRITITHRDREDSMFREGPADGLSYE